MPRPYNHADNLLPNGKPKMSEDSWALSERMKEAEEQRSGGSFNDDSKIFQSSIAISDLRMGLAQVLTELSNAREVDSGHDLQISSLQLGQSVLSSDVSMKALKGVQVTSTDATDLASAIALLNEIKLVLNAMNQE